MPAFKKLKPKGVRLLLGLEKSRYVSKKVSCLASSGLDRAD